jgi:ribonucleotide reductase alpha subunit
METTNEITPWGETGYIVYKRTYARRLNDNKADSPTEEFPDTIDRVLKSCNTQLKVGFTEEEESEFRSQLLQLKGSVAGRFLWQLGTKTVGKFGLASLQNCALTVVDDPIRPFTWTMDMLMLGCGVGVNIQREYVYQIPKVQRKKVKVERMDDSGADYIVPDTREGWVKLLGRVLKAYFYGEGFSYSTQLIRGYGAPIKSFGGVASGPEILVEGITEICKVLDSRRGKKMRPIDCLDIIDIIGMIVVAGNVRRSAIIALGDSDDFEFLRAKRWDLGDIPNWRANSNNSVVCDDISQLPEEFWEGYKGNGEPYGIINLEASKIQGRLGELQYPDPDVVGYNPCAEQSLADKETCCLAELFLPNIVSEEELFSVTKNLYRVAKHSLSLPCHNKETEAIVHQNMRMGIGVTGYEMATEEQKCWLKDCYVKLRAYDVEYSAKHGFNTSIKLTTVKPGGTLSLLPGHTSGGHPGFSQYFIRRMRIASSSELVETCRKHGYPVEFAKNFDGTENHRTCVVEFPCSYPATTTFAADQRAVDQMEVVKRLQTEWSDNAVSVTIYYKLEELDEIREWLAKNYTTSVKTMSFLLHKDHGFDQAPFEEITEEEYLARKAVSIPITLAEVSEEDISGDQIGCETGACPIK